MSELTPALLNSLWLTLRLAAIVTVLLLGISVLLGYWLANTRWRGAVLVETLINLPVVLPPTVIGFYLLALFAPQTPLGRFWFAVTGDTLAFSFSGLVIGSVIYSLPYAAQPIAGALKSVRKAHVEAAVALGATPWRAFRRVTLPLAWRGIAAGGILAFAHTLGEFGVVVMLGGSVPGKTRVASIALYDEVQKLNYPAAHAFAALLLAISFVLLLALSAVQRLAPREH